MSDLTAVNRVIHKPSGAIIPVHTLSIDYDKFVAPRVRIVSPDGVVYGGDLDDFEFLHVSPVPPSPQIWQLPPEPGPEVKAVRDRAGKIWVKGLEQWYRNTAGGSSMHLFWSGLLFYAPLADATSELADKEES